MNNDKIGKFISLKRQQKGLTQNELGERLFVTGKAVSKWERGLSLPDISLLEKLADELDTDIYDILQIKKKKDVDINEIIRNEQLRLKKIYKIKLIVFLSFIFFFILILLFKFIPFGYSIDHVRYTHYDNKLVNLAKPKFSFDYKNKENSFSYKNLRGKIVLKNEVKDYLSLLDHICCNNTTYYYDSVADVTFIDYSIKDNIFYSSISYNIRNGNYCESIKYEDYEKKLGGLGRYHTLLSNEKNVYVNFLLSSEKEDNVFIYPASLVVYYCRTAKSCESIERSSGIYEINNDDLVYYRNNIEVQSKNIKIPTTSSFVVRNGKLMLKNNYLSEYLDSVILK